MKFCPECGFDIRAFFASPDWKPKYCPECGMSLTAYLGSTASEPSARNAANQGRSTSFLPYLGYPFLLGGMYAHEASENANDTTTTDSSSAFAAGGGAFATGAEGYDMSSYGDFGGDFGGGFDCGAFGC